MILSNLEYKSRWKCRNPNQPKPLQKLNVNKLTNDLSNLDTKSRWQAEQ